MNIAQNVETSARWHPDIPAFIFENRSLSYLELERWSNRIAHGLQALGISPGTRVALFLPNIPQFAAVYLALQKLGAIAVSLNVMLKQDEIRHIVEDSGSEVVVTTRELYAEVADLRSLIRHVIVAEGDAPTGTTPLAELEGGQPDVFPARSLDPDTPSVILYTSGTTGRPKGAVLTHGNVVSNCVTTNHLVGSRPGDRHLLFLPLFHCFGQNFVMNSALLSAGTLVLERRFSAQATLAEISTQGVTHFYAVPTVYTQFLNADVPAQALSSIQYFFSAAAPLPFEIARRWLEHYGRPIYQGYGLTETSPSACYNHVHEIRIGSVGSPIDNVDMKVVDEFDQELAPGEPGEICIRGPNVMAGYWNQPDASRLALRGGWFHTGDIGYRDEDGYFYLVDRLKDMINVSGFKVWPREVEDVLFSHPLVHECAVVGQSDAVKGEQVLAFVTLRPGAAVPTEDEILSFCRERLATYKLPRRVVFVDQLPKSGTGKVLKRVLRETAG